MVNEQMRTDWSDNASGWVANQGIFDAVFTPITAAIVAAAHWGPADKVLDIGCGTGTLLSAAAAAGTRVTGVDIAPEMVAAAAARVPTADVLLADAQTDDLASAPGAPFDLVVSRFGVMFFDDPVAAFTNIASACAPGARLDFACWRSMAENPMFTLGTELLADRLDSPPTAPPPGAPGPTAFADPGRLTGILESAGWGDISIRPLDVTCVYGTGEDDGVEDRMATIASTSSGRAAVRQLRVDLGADGLAALLDEVRADLRSQVTDGHLRHPAACWLVTAQRIA